MKSVVWGAGGHAVVVADILEQLGHIVSAYLSDEGDGVRPFLKPLIQGGSIERALPRLKAEGIGWSVVAIGLLGALRQEKAIVLEEAGFRTMTLISPTATVARSAVIGLGCQILARATVGPAATVGAHTILNTQSVVEHEVRLGVGCDIAPGAVVLGGAEVGDRCLIGANATVLGKISIAANSTIGAGAVVVRNIDYPGTYVGVPARRVERRP